MRGPLAAFNALACDSSSQIHQLLDDVASHLGINVGRPALYQEYVDALLSLTRSEAQQDVNNMVVMNAGVDVERMAKHVTNYFDAKGVQTHVGFERLRKYVNGDYTDQMLFKMIDRFPDRFRRVILRGGKPAVGLLRTEK